MSIITALIDAPRHHDLHNLRIDAATLIDAPCYPASLVLALSDATTLAIRYMAPNEVLHAIRQRQLDSTLQGLRALSEWAYLLIGGVLVPNADGKVRLGNDVTGWSWAALQGALLSAQELGVQVLHLQHASAVGDAVATLVRRQRSPKRVRPPRESLWLSPAEDMLQCLPGIGEERALQLLEFCGGRADIALMALTSRFAATPGIGPKIKAQVRAALGIPADMALQVIDETEAPLNEQADILQICDDDRTIDRATKRLVALQEA